MPFSFPVPRAFSVRSIRTYAPPSPGVFGISNSRQWLLIGQSDNIQDTLLTLFSDTKGAVSGLTPTGFAYEPCDSSAQISRQDRLVLEYEPLVNRSARQTEASH